MITHHALETQFIKEFAFFWRNDILIKTDFKNATELKIILQKRAVSKHVVGRRWGLEPWNESWCIMLEVMMRKHVDKIGNKRLYSKK